MFFGGFVSDMVVGGSAGDFVVFEGIVADGIAVEGIVVEGIVVEGIVVEGMVVEGIVVEGKGNVVFVGDMMGLG